MHNPKFFLPDGAPASETALSSEYALAVLFASGVRLGHTHFFYRSGFAVRYFPFGDIQGLCVAEEKEGHLGCCAVCILRTYLLISLWEREPLRLFFQFPEEIEILCSALRKKSSFVK